MASKKKKGKPKLVLKCKTLTIFLFDMIVHGMIRSGSFVQ